MLIDSEAFLAVVYVRVYSHDYLASDGKDQKTWISVYVCACRVSRVAVIVGSKCSALALRYHVYTYHLSYAWMYNYKTENNCE